MVSRGEYSSATIHPLCQQLELCIGERAVLRVVDIAGIVRGIVAEEPDLVVVLEPEIRIRDSEVAPRRERVARGSRIYKVLVGAHHPASIVTAENIDLEADPPRKRVIAKGVEHRAEAKAPRVIGGTDPSIDYKENTQPDWHQPRSREDSPAEVWIWEVVARTSTRLHNTRLYRFVHFEHPKIATTVPVMSVADTWA